MEKLHFIINFNYTTFLIGKFINTFVTNMLYRNQLLKTGLCKHK